MKHLIPRTIPHPIAILAFLLAGGLFIKNAWVTEDAYILFRSLEQLMAGNGPRWNPHERVQVFTSPLWFWLLAAARTLSANVYLNALAISFALFLSTVFILKRLYRKPGMLLLAVLLFAASSAFYDYTSSGLENPLAYLLIALYGLQYLRLFGPSHPIAGTSHPTAGTPTDTRRRVYILWIIFGLLILVRHDLILLVLPSILYASWIYKDHVIRKAGLIAVLVALLPFICWSLFSLVYYGTFLPNSAYAKLNTGIDRILLLKQGARYAVSSLLNDSITLCLIGGTLLWTWRRARQARYGLYLGLGIALNLLYVVYVGGDFMQGRFYSYAYLLGVMLLLLHYREAMPSAGKILLWTAVLVYLQSYPNIPFSTPPNHSAAPGRWGISDERGFYFDAVSLYRYHHSLANGATFPAHYWCGEGIKFKEHPDRVRAMANIGFYGYCAGTEKILIDPLALSDPLLARLPAGDWWFIGHFRRELPEGYIASIERGEARIKDPKINAFYQRIKRITQSETLFTWERLQAIALLNLGFYNHYLEGR